MEASLEVTFVEASVEVFSLEASTTNFRRSNIHGDFHGSFHELSPKIQIVQVAQLECIFNLNIL